MSSGENKANIILDDSIFIARSIIFMILAISILMTSLIFVNDYRKKQFIVQLENTNSISIEGWPDSKNDILFFAVKPLQVELNKYLSRMAEFRKNQPKEYLKYVFLNEKLAKEIDELKKTIHTAIFISNTYKKTSSSKTIDWLLNEALRAKLNNTLKLYKQIDEINLDNKKKTNSENEPLWSVEDVKSMQRNLMQEKESMEVRLDALLSKKNDMIAEKLDKMDKIKQLNKKDEISKEDLKWTEALKLSIDERSIEYNNKLEDFGDKDKDRMLKEMQAISSLIGKTVIKAMDERSETVTH